MKEWMKYIKDYHNADESYKRLSLIDNPALVKAMDQVVAYIKENGLLGKNTPPVYNRNDADRFLFGYPEDFYNTEFLDKCYADNKHKELPELPLRSTNMFDIEDGLREEFLTAFEEYESVDDHFLKFRVHVVLPGDIVMTHYDSPGEWVRNAQTADEWRYVIPYEKSHLEMRLMVFMDDWQPGQVVQIGNDLIQWKKYDAIEWDIKNCLHGAANFGFDDRIAFLIGWIRKED